MNPHKPVNAVRMGLMLILVLVVFPLLPILITWNWGWLEAWAYFVVSLVGFVLSRALASRKHPDLLAERANFGEHSDVKPWDRVLAPAVAFGSVVILIVAGLDARFGWSPAFSLAVRLLGLVLFVAGYVIGSYAMIANRYFSGQVRIQSDRGHQVVSEGPYRWFRHPGYVGAIVSCLGVPAVFGSVWGWVPAVLLVLLVVVRTHLEDATLRSELEGYQAYADRVRYRLLPGVW